MFYFYVAVARVNSRQCGYVKKRSVQCRVFANVVLFGCFYSTWDQPDITAGKIALCQIFDFSMSVARGNRNQF